MPPVVMDVGMVGCGTGISWERNVRFELCILTASDSDAKSGGSGVNSDKRVIVNEHNLKEKKVELKIIHWIFIIHSFTCQNSFFYHNTEYYLFWITSADGSGALFIPSTLIHRVYRNALPLIQYIY